jgi:hypothetical protein
MRFQNTLQLARGRQSHDHRSAMRSRSEASPDRSRRPVAGCLTLPHHPLARVRWIRVSAGRLAARAQTWSPMHRLA